jgi:RNA polymerase sigma-70 factor (ECF subfamily)
MGSDEWQWGEMCATCLRLARRITRDSYAAEDVAQEAMLRAWRHRHNLREGDRRDQWLARIVRNEAARRHARAQPETVEQVDTAGGSEDPELASVSARLDVEVALAHLSSLDRDLLRLRYEEDLTQPAIATLLGVPEGTVKVRLHRARSKLFDQLKSRER